MNTLPGQIARDILTQVPATAPSTQKGAKPLTQLCVDSLLKSGHAGLDVFAKYLYESVVAKDELPDTYRDAILPPPRAQAAQMNAVLGPMQLSAYAQPAHQNVLDKGRGAAVSSQDILDCTAALLAEAKPLRVVARRLQALCTGTLRVKQNRSIVIESLRKRGVQSDGTLTDVAKELIATLEAQNAVSQKQYDEFMGKSVKIRMHADHLTREAKRIGRDLEGDALDAWRKLIADAAQ